VKFSNLIGPPKRMWKEEAGSRTKEIPRGRPFWPFSLSVGHKQAG